MDRHQKLRRRQMNWHRKLETIRSLMRDDRFDLGPHVYGRIAENDCSLDDIVSAVLTGVITRCEKDEKEESVDGKKYTILGMESNGRPLETVGKVVQYDDGKKYFVITCY
jgi:hypothetical protein